MINTKRFYVLITAIMLTVVVTSCKKDNSSDTSPVTYTITLTVDTSGLDLLPSDDASSVSNFGQAAGVSNADYTTDVRIGDQIIWKGISSSNPGDEVIIHAIRYVSGTNFYDGDNLGVQNDSLPGQVKRRMNGGNVGEVMKYNVEFIVDDGSGSGQIYFADPKIRIN